MPGVPGAGTWRMHWPSWTFRCRPAPNRTSPDCSTFRRRSVLCGLPQSRLNVWQSRPVPQPALDQNGADVPDSGGCQPDGDVRGCGMPSHSSPERPLHWGSLLCCTPVCPYQPPQWCMTPPWSRPIHRNTGSCACGPPGKRRRLSHQSLRIPMTSSFPASHVTCACRTANEAIHIGAAGAPVERNRTQRLRGRCRQTPGRPVTETGLFRRVGWGSGTRDRIQQVVDEPQEDFERHLDILLASPRLPGDRAKPTEHETSAA